MGHLFTAACVHYQTTAKETFLNIAIKLADYLYGVFQPRPEHLAHFGFNPSNIMGLVDLLPSHRRGTLSRISPDICRYAWLPTRWLGSESGSRPTT